MAWLVPTLLAARFRWGVANRFRRCYKAACTPVPRRRFRSTGTRYSAVGRRTRQEPSRTFSTRPRRIVPDVFWGWTTRCCWAASTEGRRRINCNLPGPPPIRRSTTPDVHTAPMLSTTPSTNTRAFAQTAAGYAQDLIQFAPKWKLLAGRALRQLQAGSGCSHGRSDESGAYGQ